MRIILFYTFLISFFFTSCKFKSSPTNHLLLNKMPFESNSILGTNKDTIFLFEKIYSKNDFSFLSFNINKFFFQKDSFKVITISEKKLELLDLYLKQINIEIPNCKEYKNLLSMEKIDNIKYRKKETGESYLDFEVSNHKKESYYLANDLGDITLFIYQLKKEIKGEDLIIIFIKLNLADNEIIDFSVFKL